MLAYVLPKKQKAIKLAVQIELASKGDVELVTPGLKIGQKCRRKWSISRVRYVINCDVAPFGKVQYQI